MSAEQLEIAQGKLDSEISGEEVVVLYFEFNPYPEGYLQAERGDV
jgi:hypothetical protein